MWIKALKEIYKDQYFLENEPMSNHTTFKIGGAAQIMVIPQNSDQIIQTIEICTRNEVPFYVLGNGSNILVEDAGIQGLVIKIEHGMETVYIGEDHIIAEAGVKLNDLAHQLLNASYTGFEFASGIPGTLGGGIFMNAGAYGSEMKDVIEWVEAISMDGKIIRFELKDLAFSYRTSIFKAKGYIIIRCGLKLKKGNISDIRDKMEELKARRSLKQPLEYPSAGSTFKRPEGYFAGQLIEQAGLRGLKFGSAQVSEKHCGFIINLGGATCSEIITLSKMVEKIVFDASGVKLEREIKIFTVE